MPPTAPKDMPPRAPYVASYAAIWNTITDHKTESSLDVRIHDTLAPLLADLHTQRLEDPRAIYDIHFHRSLLAAELAPLLVLTEHDFAAMPPEVFQGAIERVREVVTFQIHDILQAFETGVTIHQMEALDGILHEITPMGAYSHGDTLLLPASDADDRFNKTDLDVYRKTDTIRHERVQCKRNRSSSPYIPGVILIDAADYGNRADPRSGVHRLNNTSYLLVEAANGDALATERLSKIGDSFWKLADYRLSAQFKTDQTDLYGRRMRDLRFPNRIPAEMLTPFMTPGEQ